MSLSQARSDDVRSARERLGSSLLTGDVKNVVAATRELLTKGVTAGDILAADLVPAMDKVGERFSRGEYFLPEMLAAAHAMQSAVHLLEPLMTSTPTADAESVVLGTVAGDIHDIGKNIVAANLRGAGFAVYDLGVDVPATRFVEAVNATRATVVALSALLTTTMPAMAEVIDSLAEAGMRQDLVVLVGGAPLTPAFAACIGADGYAADAATGARLARKLVARTTLTERPDPSSLRRKS